MFPLRPLLLSTLVLSALPALAQAPAKALSAISALELSAHIKTLASDEFAGRAPGTPGEAKTVAYLRQEFAKLGLQPGNPDGSWVQAVPMRGQKPAPNFSYTIGGQKVALKFEDDFVAHSTGQPSTVTSTIRKSCLSATACRRRNTAGTTTRASTCAAKPC